MSERTDYTYFASGSNHSGEIDGFCVLGAPYGVAVQSINEDGLQAIEQALLRPAQGHAPCLGRRQARHPRESALRKALKRAEERANVVACIRDRIEKCRGER